jgi:uncharacterized protein with HEPN domain
VTRDYSLFIKDILQAINDIEAFIGDMDYAAFQMDEKTKSAVVWKITNIGEAAKNLPKTIRVRYRSIPWKDMAKMRDKIAHQYFGIDYELVWGVIKKELPAIKPEIEKIVQ